MNNQFGRLLLAGLCALIVAPAATAQDSSHRLLPDADLGSLSQAEGLLARRLRHQQDIRNFEEIAKELKNLNPEQFKDFEKVIKNNPQLLDNPDLSGILNDVKEFQQKGRPLSKETQEKLLRLANEIRQNAQDDSSKGLVNGGSPEGRHVPPNDVIQPPDTPPPPNLSKPEGIGGEIKQDLTDLVKKLTSSSESEALRKAVLTDLAKPDDPASTTSSALSDLLAKLISPRQASWLSRNLKLPSLPNFDGEGFSPGLSAVSPAGGASSGGGMDAVVWVVALGLFGVAAVLALRVAQRQTGGGAKAWSAGPWPVHPSRVSTREDLIRAFEHLAFLRLGLRARPLNHRDLAGRLGDTGDRAEPAARLAHLYEQARYAPSDELLPADELAVARDDLSTLAGAAA